MKKISVLFFASLCLFITGYSQVVPTYMSYSPTPSGANFNGSGMPFGANGGAGARVQIFYPPNLFGASVTDKFPVKRLYFYSDTPHANPITYGNISITLGEYASTPSTGFSWSNNASKLTQVLLASAYQVNTPDSNWFYFDLPTTYMYDPTRYLFLDIKTDGQSPFTNVWNVKSSPITGGYVGAYSSNAGSPNTLSTGAQLPAIGMDPIKGVNNAGITRPVFPSVCANNQDVIVRVKNSGSNTINTVMVGWSINGVTQTPVSLNAPLDTFGSAKNDSLLTIGNVNFASGPLSIVAWTYLPNNSADFLTIDDTVSFSMGSSLTGAYMISPRGTGFQTIASAVSALYTYGVCGPVAFTIDTSIYFEVVDLQGRINGASPVNTVTFSGLDRDKTIISSAPSIVNAKHLVRMQNVAYVTFRNLTVRTTSPTYGWGFHLRDSCKAVAVRNCVIDLSLTSASTNANNTVGISISGPPTGTCIPAPCATSPTAASRVDSLEIDSNTILYGYEGINITGNATLNMGRNNKIRNNTILYAYQNAINLVSQENVQVLNNTIFLRQTGAVSVGIFANSVTSTTTGTPTIISGNKISGYATAGISMNASTSADSTNKGRIVNNMVGGMEQLVDANPIFITGCKNWAVSHNTLNRDFALTSAITASGIRVLGTTSNISIRNNVISVSKAGTALPVHILATTNIDTMDGNVFYRGDISNGQVLTVGATTYTTANFKGGAGFNTNSVFTRPAFRNDTSLYITANCNFPSTQLLGYATTDIDGTTRNNPPVAGAYELVRANNNVTVLAVQQPASPVTPGTYVLKALVQNLGANAVSSFKLSYRVNSASVVDVPTTLGTPLNPCDSVVVTVNGMVIGTNDTIARLIVYTSQPNSFTDADPSNDTLTMKLYSPLGGDYTLGGAGAHFASFAEATSALKSAGIKSAVRFNVNPGTYNEQVTLTGPFTGSSPLNTITFEGIDTATRIISYAANSVLPHTVKIDSAKYVTFRNLSILTTGSTWGWGVHITRNANGCKIRNCKVSITGAGTTNTTVNYAGITVSGATLTTATRADSLEIDSNVINYGYNSINIFSATGAANVSIYNRIRNNVLLNAQQNAIGLTFQQTPEVTGNTIVCRGSTTGVGILGQNVTTPATGALYTLIQRNKISNYATAGISLNTATNAAATLKGRIINNTLSGEKLAAGNSMILTSSTNWSIANNTISHDFSATTAATAAGIRLVGAVAATFGVAVVNNVIAVTGTGIALPFYTQVAGNVDSLDYNLYYRNDSTNSQIIFLGANVLYPALKTATLNKNSVIYKPGFTSATDLTPNPADSCVWSINGRGVYLPYTALDLAGNQRPTTPFSGVPDIGAYEVIPTSIPPLATAVPPIITGGSTQVYLFAADTVAKITWVTGYSGGGTLNVRQYSGAKPPQFDPLLNYMYFYTSTSATPAPADSILFFYRDNWIGSHTSENNLKCTMSDSSTIFWAPQALSGVNTTRNSISLLNYSVSGGATYLTGSDNGVLPVKLIDLSAAKVQNDILLNWSTASEENSSRFEVERSLDAAHFGMIGRVAAKGNSSIISNYRFTDRMDNIPANAKVIYYRLKMIDKDGSYEYSKTVTVSPGADKDKNSNISVYPNPFSSEFYINATIDAADDQALVTVTDLAGKTVLVKKVSLAQGSNTIQIAQQDALQPGVYFVSLSTGNTTYVRKLIK